MHAHSIYMSPWIPKICLHSCVIVIFLRNQFLVALLGRFKISKNLIQTTYHIIIKVCKSGSISECFLALLISVGIFIYEAA